MIWGNKFKSALALGLCLIFSQACSSSSNQNDKTANKNALILAAQKIDASCNKDKDCEAKFGLGLCDTKTSLCKTIDGNPLMVECTDSNSCAGDFGSKDYACYEGFCYKDSFLIQKNLTFEKSTMISQCQVDLDCSEKSLGDKCVSEKCVNSKPVDETLFQLNATVETSDKNSLSPKLQAIIEQLNQMSRFRVLLRQELVRSMKHLSLRAYQVRVVDEDEKDLVSRFIAYDFIDFEKLTPEDKVTYADLILIKFPSETSLVLYYSAAPETELLHKSNLAISHVAK